MKNNHIMTTLFLATALAFSCGKDDLLPDPKNNDYSIIDGDTIKTRVENSPREIISKTPLAGSYVILGDTIVMYEDLKFHTQPSKIPDLKNLKNNVDAELKGKPFRFVAIGGSITAGFRDGGYFNEGILTSYPNLIARQMRLEKFEQPLFEPSDYNGTGRNIPTNFNITGGPVQKFKLALNNNGIDRTDGKKVTLKSVNNSNLDNFAVPFLKRPAYGAMGDYSSFPEYIQNDVYTSLFNRVISHGENYRKVIFSRKFDFAIIEFPQIERMFHDFGSGDLGGSISTEGKIFEEKPYEESRLGWDWDVSAPLYLLRRLEEAGVTKGVLLNMPDYLKFPYFTFVSNDLLDKNLGKDIFVKFSGFNGGTYSRSEDIMLPTSAIDSLLSPKVNLALKKGVFNNPPIPSWGNLVVNGKTVDCCSIYNKEIELLGKRFNFPVVNLNEVYNTVIKGSYISGDGLRVTSKEFFSTDGIHPSALGQSVIANEVIKTINSFYKMDIQQISIKEYYKNK